MSTVNHESKISLFYLKFCLLTLSGCIVALTESMLRLAAARESKSGTNAMQVALARDSDTLLMSIGSAAFLLSSLYLIIFIYYHPQKNIYNAFLYD